MEETKVPDAVIPEPTIPEENAPEAVTEIIPAAQAEPAEEKAEETEAAEEETPLAEAEPEAAAVEAPAPEPEVQETAGETVPEQPPVRVRKPLRTEAILGIMALVWAVILAVMIVVCMPYFGAEQMEEDPLLAISKNPPATMPIPTEETEPGVTEPQPEKNPYGKLDFQYEGRYLGCLKADTVPGIDVSYYQGDIDWEKVKASGIEFAMIRLGYRGYGKEGKLVEDKKAMQNIQGALSAGIKVGIYFFSQAISVEEALEEADFVLERIQGCNISMPVVFDWEYVSEEARTAKMDRRTLTDCYIAFCEKIAEAGYTPMPYFNTFQSRSLMHLTELEEYPFWLALYSDRMTFPHKIEMWQYTDSGKVPGIEGYVDINLFFTED